MDAFVFPDVPATSVTEHLRGVVREFLAGELQTRTAAERARSWNGFDLSFSRSVGRQGWIGMTWPQKYGGGERSAVERYVVMEEMLAAGAPVAAHWIADRQSGPTLLRFGTEDQRRSILPRIAAGECCFCIGMSEAGSGSDLAGVQTRAVRSADGYVVNGTKFWVTNAHRADYMILFCRTSGQKSDRQVGTSQFLVDMRSPGLTVRPIRDLTGEHDFNEVHFEDVRLAPDALIGQEGAGWQQVTSELAHERSGPERVLSSITLLTQLIEVLGPDAPERAAIAIGRLSAHLVALRRLSRGVAGLLEAGENPQLQAALVKSLGSMFEQEVPEQARQLVDLAGANEAAPDFHAAFDHTVLMAPAYSLRGGTREILRNIIARGLGLR